jgi:hypothetical protein
VDRQRRPATALAREALECWIKEREREAVQAELAVYVSACAGTDADLDPALEAAGVEAILASKDRS